jgi:chromosomal replication initiator protein
VAFASLTDRALTADLAAEVLADLYPDLRRPARITVSDVQEAAARAFGVTPEDMRSPGRAGTLAWARHVAMYLSRELTDATLPAIGREFSRNHTTVIHACRRTAERIASDPEAYETVRRLTAELRGSGP